MIKEMPCILCLSSQDTIVHGPSQSELLFQPGSPFSSYKALPLLSVSLHPADNVWALLPSHPGLLWMQAPYFSAFLL